MITEENYCDLDGFDLQNIQSTKIEFKRQTKDILYKVKS